MIVIRLYKVLIDTYRLLLIPKDTHLLSQESLYSAKGRLLVLLGYFKNLLWQGHPVGETNEPCLPSWRMPCNQLNGYSLLPKLSQK